VTEGITWVGLDAHKASISIAMLLPGQRQPMEWQTANQPAAVRRLARKLVRESPGEVRCCYEAGPCGYALQRQLLAEDVVCEVVAPSLIPVKPGDHIKTDRRDAKKLAELFRAGLLTEVQPPTEEQESARDLCRCREDAIEDRARCRHRLLKLLLRRGLAYPGQRPWKRSHDEWLRSIRFERAAEQAVFEDYQLAIIQVDERPPRCSRAAASAWWWPSASSATAIRGSPRTSTAEWTWRTCRPASTAWASRPRRSGSPTPGWCSFSRARIRLS